MLFFIKFIICNLFYFILRHLVINYIPFSLSVTSIVRSSDLSLGKKLQRSAKRGSLLPSGSLLHCILEVTENE